MCSLQFDMSAGFHTPPREPIPVPYTPDLKQPVVGWGEATRRFFFTREGGLVVTKLLFMFGLAASIADEPLDIVPGVDLLTFGDDVLWFAIPAYAIIRIAWIRHRANARPLSQKQQATA